MGGRPEVAFGLQPLEAGLAFEQNDEWAVARRYQPRRSGWIEAGVGATRVSRSVAPASRRSQLAYFSHAIFGQSGLAALGLDDGAQDRRREAYGLRASIPSRGSVGSDRHPIARIL